MPTINASRTGVIVGPTNSDFSTARSSAGSSATDNPNSNLSVQFFVGRGAHRFSRAFIHFDTSSITTAVSAAHIDIAGGTIGSPDPNDTILIKSTAFGGDGGTAIANSDMFSSLDYSTAYSTELTGWNQSANNEYTLTAAALSDIQNNDDFIVAVIMHDPDYANTDTNQTEDIVIDFGTTITLDYTLAPVGYQQKVSGVAASNLKRVNTVLTANIEKVNTVD
tara:strand:- start:364 stop:1029 length:666 start_codon:yes stop_codon:yes gene_type:complete